MITGSFRGGLGVGLLLATLSAPSQTFTVPDAGFPVDVLVQSPALTQTDLQTICVFRPDAGSTFRGSLKEIDEKLGGLLSQVRQTGLFRGDLGETLLIAPKAGTIPARRLLIIGLGDLQGFSPDREQVVGFVFFTEVGRLGVRHPYFAPTVLDGGKEGMDTGDVAEQFLSGFLRARASQDLLQHAGVSAGGTPISLTFLAGAAHAERSRAGLALAIKSLHNQK